MLWPLHGSCCVAVLCQIAAVKRRGEGNFSLAADRQKVAPMLVPVLRRKLLSLLKAEEYVTYRVVLNQQSVNLRGLGVKDFYKPIPALEDDDVVEEFIHQNGFTSIFQRDPAGWLPLHYASLRGSVQVIQGLLAMRANPNQKTTKDQPLVGLPQFTSALTICVYFRHYEATQLLISAKASLTGGIRTLCAARCSVHHRNLLGASVFDTACAHGTIQAVEELLRQTGGDGIDMTCALHVAMTHHGGSAELVKRLVDFRADVNDQSFTWWRAGTGLGLLSIQKAIQRKFGKQTLCTKMTYHGGHGGTPLMLAMLSSQYEGAAALVALGVRVEPQNAGGGGRRILLKERRQTPTFGI